MNENENALLVNGSDTSEHKRADETLLKLKKAVDHSGEVIFITDKEGVFTFINPAFTAVYGYTPDEIIGKATPRILKSGLLKPQAYKLFWENLLNGKEVRGEIINKRKDGTIVNIENTANTIFDDEGNIIGFLGIQSDISERKKAEVELRTAHDKYQLLLDSIAEGAYGVDNDDNCTFVNKSFLNLLGYQDANELIGKQIHLLMHHSHPDGSTYPASECKMLNSRITKQKINVSDEVFWRKDGVAIPVEYWSYPIIKEDKVIGAICTFVDITERKKSEEAIRESEKMFRILYNETPVMMHSINQQGELLSVSDFWLEKLGYQREEVLGRKFSDFLTENSRKKAIEIFLPEFKTTGHIENADYSFMKKNGEVIDCLLSAISQRDNNKNFIRSLAVITDITERKLAEETIRKSEEKYRDIVENISDLICTHDMNGRILSVNPAAVKLLGYETDALLKMSIHDILAPEVKEQYSTYVAALKKDGYAHGFMKVQTAAGNIRIWEYNNTLRTHGVTTPIVRGLSKDITEQKLSERALQQSETNLRAIFENTNTGFLLLDTEFNIISANERGKELIKVAFGEKSRKENNLYKMLPYERKQIFSDHQSKVLQGGIVHYEVSYPQHDGSVVWFEINCKPVTNVRNSVVGISFAIADITERKNAFEKLVKAESQIRNFARHLNQVIEEEKANIAREIHDELGQQLAGIKMGLASLKKKQSPPPPEGGIQECPRILPLRGS